jgi:hypothetical protein
VQAEIDFIMQSPLFDAFGKAASAVDDPAAADSQIIAAT